MFSKNYAIAQVNISMVVCDSNKMPLPYTNIVSTMKHTGTTTDVTGKFILLNADKKDTLKITNISFLPFYLPVAKAKTNDTIVMSGNIRTLNEVIVRDWNAYTIDQKLGFFDYSKHATFILDPGVEVAVYIENPRKRKALIKNVYFGVREKGINGASIRIRIFGANPIDGEPSNDLLLDNVVLNNKELSHKNYLNISQYRVMMPANGVFVAIECVSAADNIKEQDKTSLTENTDMIKNLLWLNYRDKKWGHSHIPRRENGSYMTPDIGVNVGYSDR